MSTIVNTTKYLAKPNKTIYEHNSDMKIRVQKLKDIGYIKDDHTYNLIIMSIDGHDVGKFNKYMQNRIKSSINGKKIKFDKDKEVSHNILSLILFVEEYYDKNKEDFNEDDFLKIAHAILNHHHYVDNIEFLKDINNDILINDCLSELGVTKNISQRLLKKLVNPNLINDKEAILIKGYLHRVDYSASSNSEIEYINDFLVERLNEWFKNNNYKTNELQEYCKQNSDENCITIAQVGMGKTEAGLYWIGENKGFFFLPLRVSNNAIYNRCKKQLFNNLNYEEKVGLLHSNSLDYYSLNESEESDTIKHYEETKNLSLPLIVSTVDQLFNFVYKYPGYESKIATLNNSHCVIDEFQSYNPQITASLILGIERLVDFGTKVHILTATLPPYLIDLLNKNVKFKFNKFLNDDIKRHNIKVMNTHINAQDIYKHFQEKGGKILTICNTVKQAQSIYDKLKTLGLDENNLKLLHSRFTNGDRENIENDILEVGKSDHKENIIYITTQIVEASLDIDFDYLFTELCDLNSLFQRLGRCNRKGLKPVDEYNCFVYLKINKFLLNKIVDEALYELSCEALSNIDGLLLETKKDELINTYLTTENLKKKNSKFLREYKEHYDLLSNISTYSFSKDDAKLRDISTVSFIPYSVYDENKDEIENNIMIMQNNKRRSDEYIKAKNKINSFIVSAPAYKKNDIGTIYKEFLISNYEKIEIRNCFYSKEVGLKFNSSGSINDKFL